MLRFAVVLAALVFVSGLLSRAALADEGPLDPAPPKGTTTEEIIRRFASKETEFQQARDQYTYRQDVKVQTPEANIMKSLMCCSMIRGNAWRT